MGPSFAWLSTCLLSMEGGNSRIFKNFALWYVYLQSKHRYDYIIIVLYNIVEHNNSCIYNDATCS